MAVGTGYIACAFRRAAVYSECLESRRILNFDGM